MLIIKSRKRKTAEVIEIPIQQKIWSLGVKETFKYLGILEANSLEQAEIFFLILKNTWDKSGNYSKPNEIAEISSKGYAPELSPT